MATLRLFCLSYAGGSAALFREWPQAIGQRIDICPLEMPGRGTRFSEPLSTSLFELAEQLSGCITRLDDLPFAFFGYSLGGLLAWEIACQRREQGLSLPRRLVVAASAAPQFPTPDRGLRNMDDAGLLRELSAYNGTPAMVLENDELLRLMLPVIRSDFALIENYVRDALRLPLPIPIDVLHGSSDPHVTTRQALGWKLETTAGYRCHAVEGDHFFIHTAAARVTAIVDACLAMPPVSSNRGSGGRRDHG